MRSPFSSRAYRLTARSSTISISSAIATRERAHFYEADHELLQILVNDCGDGAWTMLMFGILDGSRVSSIRAFSRLATE